ncbi:GNAT family N-acetyltransferase [Chitinimonas sp. BJYL2]|uniref:GNAT family N-acetyltransferase n=1 Tax=Chitinimonas sp. BJYL2 TaxID=2976696 RepID=UPI0022B499C8|nr:GNAT family N-acetyltransferase [Chitinimonas sp. BJYL2]
MNTHVDIEIVSAASGPLLVPELAALLIDVVEHDASIGFLAPLGMDAARRYWQGVVEELTHGNLRMWVARVNGLVVGTVQLDPCPRANGRNRAEVCKLMVHSGSRGQGIASLLMAALEGCARKLDRGLLYLDTEAGSPAEKLYQSLGYTRVGTVPDYAAKPDGTLIATAYYYKQLIDRSLSPMPGGTV